MDTIDHLLNRIHQSDNLTGLKKFPDNCIDACITDPPYGLQFMGKHWDYDVPKVDIWREVLRVLKPGAYLLSFFGTRTYHRGVIAIEDAGFEIRDQIGWCYGSGFPKSHDISKGIDKQKGTFVRGENSPNNRQSGESPSGCYSKGVQAKSLPNPQSEQAKQWKGWGTALKPAWEPIVVARKPISEDTVAANVLKWGTGGINIDGCRIFSPNNEHFRGIVDNTVKENTGEFKATSGFKKVIKATDSPLGRWPANIITDGSDEVLAGFPDSKAGIDMGKRGTGGIWATGDGVPCGPQYGDSGSAARFFYTAKASKWDRNEDCEGMEVKQTCGGGMNNPECAGAYGSVKAKAHNFHPTVKPTDLMQYLCRLVTPPDGIVLDPYAGSGSTGKAALLECFRFIGFERENEYCKIANARIAFIKGQLELF